MGRRFVLILGFALVIGLVTSSLVYRAITQKVAAEPSVQLTGQIVVAAANLNLGEAVTSEHVRLVSWPKESMPAGTFGTVAEAEGRVALTSIVVGEPLLDAKLAPKLAGGGILPMLVPENLRGVTIKVDDAVRETGFVSPNSRVDVVVSIADNRGSGERTAKVILQNVPVLAAGQSVEMRGNKPVPVTTVTLALTPEQVERLALAQTEGRLMLATRNLGDERIIQTPGTNVKKLLDQVPAPSPKEASSARVARPKNQSPSYTVTVFRGTKMTEENFAQNGGSEWVEQVSKDKKTR
ncbi:MAG TPA: Flp pilus assembly protein CpaB [Candidatus Binatia bacterium]|jgi:pilus assembly protein CpaB|nr:Flp pilus assembly protein CpaB [Candidatus Binatia bacterium]